MSNPTVIKGRCHCGNISYQFQTQNRLDQIAVRHCTCSFCTMHGGVYTSDPDGELRYRFNNNEQIQMYRFGHQTADFVVCKTCGVMPFVLSEIGGITHAVLNVNTAVDPVIATDDPAKMNFDGEIPDDRLARRHKNWIGNVIEE